MPQVLVFSVASLLMMLGVATFAAYQEKSDRGPASSVQGQWQGQGIPKDLYHSAKY